MTSSFEPTTSPSPAGGALSRTLVTTSWDDGHPSDLRLAEMLAERGLKATFYIPRSSQRPTLTPEQIRRIAARFEIGAHTLDHVVLTDLPPDECAPADRQSKKWVRNVTGQPCDVCAPSGGSPAITS